MNYCDFNIDSLSQNCYLNGKLGFDEIIIFHKDALASMTFADITSGSFTFVNPGNVADSVTGASVSSAFAAANTFSNLITDARAVKFNSSAKSMSGGTMYNTTQKTLQFVIKNNGADISAELTRLKNGEFVIAAKRPAPYADPTDANITATGASNYNAMMIELFGTETKMRCTACEQILAGEDADGGYYGGYLITMQCTELSDGVYYTHQATSNTGITAADVNASWNTLTALDWTIVP